MTAMATASTKNCTNLIISRVKRKKIATIPTIPRNSGPKRVCRYVTSPELLSATGAAVASMCVAMVTPGVMSAALGGGAWHARGISWHRPGLRGSRPDPSDQPGSPVPEHGEGVRHVDLRWPGAMARGPSGCLACWRGRGRDGRCLGRRARVRPRRCGSRGLRRRVCSLAGAMSPGGRWPRAFCQPRDGDCDPSDRACRRGHAEPPDSAKRDDAAESGDRIAWRRELAELQGVAARVRAEERGEHLLE